ncbi:universal stress protein [Tropicimonas sp. TH_r6]|uniref:universal stress protein n=1 Tax=Tropicimonas sp. TH_r6 TaxID=3082085 RepID=UPI0029546432|nr:universal stress protein [Tropicimonas sp. TH_r6]MDV7143163.1 universal stress protein [Tropicimonas sp. TH_r6]
MKNATILLVIGTRCPERELAARLEEARSLSAHIAILVVGEAPWNPATDYAAGVVDIQTWMELTATVKTELKAMAERAERQLQQHDISGDVTTRLCERTAIASAVVRRALVCDFAFIGQDLRETSPGLFREAVYGVLFHSPAGVLLNDLSTASALSPRHVFIAWNTGLEAGRAVHQALPLLCGADEVTIATFDPVMAEYQDGENPGSDVAKWLSHHGCNVRVEQYPGGGKEIGTAILERSNEGGADLIVMGAYGHSRLRESVFGGTTRTLIEQTDKAVFLAH